MARGWESKEVESQIEAAETRAAEAAKPRLTPEQIARQREIESLHLSRTRVLQDLENSVNPKYREMLQRSLAFLDQKISRLSE
jgi:molecular chaperone DnaK (HSP70)